jgi:hypothetical protein
MRSTVSSRNDRAGMRISALHCLVVGAVSFLAGAVLCGYVVIPWAGRVVDLVRSPSSGPPPADDLPASLTWLPVGGGLLFVGLALILLGFLAPRDRRSR